jgi:transcriptional regulator with XRE-family HTH domain
MEKSLVTKEYSLFLAFLKKARQDTGLTQEQLAKKLKTTQSFVSKAERGERRLDVIELRRWTRAIGLSLSEFAVQMEAYIKSNIK